MFPYRRRQCIYKLLVNLDKDIILYYKSRYTVKVNLALSGDLSYLHVKLLL